MKRMWMIWAALALVFLCAPGTAEENRPVLTDFDDFTLQTREALAYQGEKADGQPLFLFYPSAEGNVAMAAVNAVWIHREEPFTPEEFTGMHRTSEAGIKAQYEAGGYLLKSFEVGETVETEYWNLPALVCDAELTVTMNDTDVVLVQRGIVLTGAFGTYRFSLSAWSRDLLDEATGELIRALQWKQQSPDGVYE